MSYDLIVEHAVVVWDVGALLQSTISSALFMSEVTLY